MGGLGLAQSAGSRSERQPPWLGWRWSGETLAVGATHWTDSSTCAESMQSAGLCHAWCGFRRLQHEAGGLRLELGEPQQRVASSVEVGTLARVMTCYYQR